MQACRNLSNTSVYNEEEATICAGDCLVPDAVTPIEYTGNNLLLLPQNVFDFQ